jgi:hypothetical protein
MKHGRLPVLFAAWLLLAFAAQAAAQAWVPEKGDGSFTTGYNYLSFKGHFTSEGNKVAEAGSRAQSIVFDLEYGITNRLAVTLSVPIVAARYADTNPPSAFLQVLFTQAVQAVGPGFYGHSFLDDQRYHTTVQDIQLNVRYNILSRPLVVTPFVAML